MLQIEGILSESIHDIKIDHNLAGSLAKSVL